jgi:hypothetical protein
VRAQPLGLRSGDPELLESWTRSSSIRAGLAQRARIVLLAADGVSNTEIAELVGVSRPTVIAWRDRYVSSVMQGLHDEQRSGRPRTVDRGEILAATLTPPPTRLCHALVASPARGLSKGGCLDGVADLAALPGPAVAGGDVQVLKKANRKRTSDAVR